MCTFWSISILLDPDPHSQYGSGSITLVGAMADPEYSVLRSMDQHHVGKPDPDLHKKNPRAVEAHYGAMDPHGSEKPDPFRIRINGRSGSARYRNIRFISDPDPRPDSTI